MKSPELYEMQVRSALAAIAGTEPNGNIFVASEVKISDTAVAAMFGAIGVLLQRATSDRPKYHIIHRTANGIFFVPVYVQIGTGYVIVPEENFYIPHADIAKLTVVQGLLGAVYIDIKLQSGKKLQFNTQKKIRGIPFQASNLGAFRVCYAVQSHKKQVRNYIFIGVLFALFVLLLLVPFLIPDTPSEGASDRVYKMKNHLIADTVLLDVPLDFQPLTAEELAEYDDEDGVIAGFAHETDDVGVLVMRTETNWTNDDLVALYEEEKQKQNARYSVSMEAYGYRLQTQETVQVDNAPVYITEVYFLVDGYLYKVLYSCGESAVEQWGDADSAVMASIRVPKQEKAQVFYPTQPQL